MLSCPSLPPLRRLSADEGGRITDMKGQGFMNRLIFIKRGVEG